MSLDSSPITTVIFDYGNTLIQFTRAQMNSIDSALTDHLQRHLGDFDREQLRELRNQDRERPFQGDPPSLRENDTRAFMSGMLAELYGRTPSAAEVEAVSAFSRDALGDAITTPDYLHDLLDDLGQRYRLALLSNYPDGRTIRQSLDQVGITDRFAAIVVSGEVGWVKPHPATFAAVLDQAGATAEESVYVGDNWLADVQGARRAGLQSILTTQWEAASNHVPEPGDLPAHCTIGHLRELLDHL